MKLLAWAALILLVLWALRSNKGARDPSASAHRTAEPGTEAMVRCAHCGIYVPASESVADASGTSYCSEEHRLRHAS